MKKMKDEITKHISTNNTFIDDDIHYVSVYCIYCGEHQYEVIEEEYMEIDNVCPECLKYLDMLLIEEVGYKQYESS